jgi:hypothetical protein
MSLKKINEQLQKGVLPDDFKFFETPNQDNLDWNKVKYNAFYKEYDYHFDKLPKALHNIPGIESIVEMNMNLARSPLEEILERQKISINNIDEEKERSENIDRQIE